MIEKEKFHVLNYVKKEEYTGSDSGMRYMLKTEGEDRIKVTIWPEPNSFAHTKDELKIVEFFPLSEDGVMDICDYLNRQHEQLKDLWKI